MLFFRFNGLRFRFRDDKEDANKRWHGNNGRFITHGYGASSFFSKEHRIPDKVKKQEYAKFMHQVNTYPNLYKGRHGKECCTHTYNYFYCFIYDAEEGNHQITEWFAMEGHKQEIEKIEKELGNG